MKRIIGAGWGMAAAVLGLALSAMTTHAIEGLRISVVQSNVVLGWPSQTNETFIVQWRAAFETNCPWVTLATNHLAATATNWTVFTHTNQIPRNTNVSTMGGGGGGPPPMLMASTTASTADAAEEKIKKTELPPMPWDPSSWSTSKTKPAKGGGVSALNGLEPMGGGGSEGTNYTCGFYRVVRTGAHLIRLADYNGDPTLPQFTLELGFAQGEVGAIDLVNEGGVIPGTPHYSPPFTNLAFVVNTMRLTNGIHPIQAHSRLTISPATNDAVATEVAIDVQSQVYPLTVSNLISFPYWEPNFDTTVWIQARCAQDVADYYVHYFDDQAQYIGTMGGHTTNGFIRSDWNLVLPNGQLYAGLGVQAVVETRWTENGQNKSASAVTPPVVYLAENSPGYPNYGSWVVARQKAWDGLPNAAELNNAITNIANGLRTLASTTFNLNFSVQPKANIGGTDIGAFSITGSKSNPNLLTNQWFTLLTGMVAYNDSRNFIYLGHADKNGLGGYDKLCVPGSFYGLTWQDIGQALGNGRWHVPGTNAKRQRYRFALVYGCSTARSLLPEALGITPLTRDEKNGNYGGNGGPRPRAFVGFDYDVVVAAATGGGFGVYTRHQLFLERFWGNWSVLGLPLDTAISQAIDQPTQLDTASLNSLQKIIGYQKLGFMEGNTR